MPKCVTRSWLNRVAGGLTSGALALSLLSAGGGASGTLARPVLADEIDCYNDKDLYSLPECVERRELDRKSGNAQNESQGAPIFGPGPREPGSEQAGSTEGEGEQQSAGSGGQQAAGASQPPAAHSEDDEDEDNRPAPHVAATDPHTVVLTIADAGKEATQFISDEGSDKFGKWARTRYERDRSNGASALGPNVMDSKVWIAKDVETAKTLFKEQAGIKNFPERKESVQGPVEKVKPTRFGEEFAYASGYYQDGDDKVWQHWRMVIRRGNVVSVLYLFGREAYFQNEKSNRWEPQGDFFSSTLYNRM